MSEPYYSDEFVTLYHGDAQHWVAHPPMTVRLTDDERRLLNRQEAKP